MNAKSSARLRLECLETRSLLSAIGLPLVPPLAPPSTFAAAGEFDHAGGHRTHAAMQAEIEAALPATLDPMNRPNAAAATNDSIEAGAGATSNAVDAGAGASDIIDTRTPDLGMPRHAWLPSHNLADPALLSLHASMQLRSADGLPPSAPDGDDPVGLPLAMGEVDITILNSPVSRGPVDFRGPLVRDSEQAVVPAVASDPTTVDPAAPPVKVHSPDTSATSDANRSGDPTALATEENPWSASSGIAIPPATTAALADATAWNSVEGGFISLDDTTATPGFSSGPSAIAPNKGAAAGTDSGQGRWLADILSNPGRPADSGRNTGTAHSRLAADAASRSAEATGQSPADAEEGGGIELAMAVPSPVAGDALRAGSSQAASEAQSLADIRPESGVGLFCDIEVSEMPALPSADRVSAATPATPYQSTVSVLPAPRPGRDARPATGVVPQSTAAPQSMVAGLADRLPVLLGLTVLVSGGGLRLEEKVPQRELRSSEDLR